MCVCVYIYCVFVRSDVVFRLSNFLFVNFGEIGVEFCTVLFVEIIDGGKNPTFQEKFTFTLIEGLRELNVFVWNSNTLTYDDFIGSGKLVNCSLLMIYQLFFSFWLGLILNWLTTLLLCVPKGFNCKRCFLGDTTTTLRRYRLKLAGGKPLFSVAMIGVVMFSMIYKFQLA